jgi:hypothetical protein
VARVFLEADLRIAAPQLELPYLKRRCGIKADLEARVGVKMDTGAAPSVAPGVVTIIKILPEEV